MKKIHYHNLYEHDEPRSSRAVRSMADTSEAEYTLVYTAPGAVRWGLFAAERMLQIAEDTSAGMV